MEEVNAANSKVARVTGGSDCADVVLSDLGKYIDLLLSEPS